MAPEEAKAILETI
jgi:hypothetical protein